MAEPERVNDELAEQFTILLMGFLVYGTQQNGRSLTCDIVAAPRATALPHRPMLVLSAGAIESLEGQLHIRLADGAAIVRLDGLSLSLPDGGEGPATTENFQHLPAFDTLVCGAQIDPSWRDRPELQFAMRFCPGHLKAWPGLNSSCWSWTDCAGRLIEQPVYQVVSFQPQDASARRLVFTSRADGSTVASLKLHDALAGENRLAFVGNAPADLWDDPRKEIQGLKVDLAHVEAMLTLHTITGDLRVSFGTPCGGRPAESKPELVSALAERAGVLEPAWTRALVEMLQNGRPHCGKRTLLDA